MPNNAKRDHRKTPRSSDRFSCQWPRRDPAPKEKTLKEENIRVPPDPSSISRKACTESLPCPPNGLDWKRGEEIRNHRPQRCGAGSSSFLPRSPLRRAIPASCYLFLVQSNDRDHVCVPLNGTHFRNSAPGRAAFHHWLNKKHCLKWIVEAVLRSPSGTHMPRASGWLHRASLDHGFHGSPGSPRLRVLTKHFTQGGLGSF